MESLFSNPLKPSENLEAVFATAPTSGLNGSAAVLPTAPRVPLAIPIALPATAVTGAAAVLSTELCAALASLPTVLPLTSCAVLPAMIDCQPALSASIPVRSPLAFSIATVPAQIITSLPIVLTTEFSTS